MASWTTCLTIYYVRNNLCITRVTFGVNPSRVVWSTLPALEQAAFKFTAGTERPLANQPRLPLGPLHRPGSVRGRPWLGSSTPTFSALAEKTEIGAHKAAEL